MKSKASVRPSKASAIATVIIGTLFLVFAVVFIGNTAEGEARPYVLMFMVIWIAVCGFMIVYGLTIIFSKRPPAVTEIDMEDRQSDSPGAGIDFVSKLRKLESLRREGLINEEEYKTKRSEIMQEKW